MVKLVSILSFDHQLVEAKLALKRISPIDMPSLACDALEAGLDGPFIRKLAALINPSGWEVDQILPDFMANAGLKRISSEEASIRLARNLAVRILSEGLDPLDHTKDFEWIWIDANYPKAISDAGTLDEDIYIAKSCGQTEDELREYARTVLSAIASKR